MPSSNFLPFTYHTENAYTFFFLSPRNGRASDNVATTGCPKEQYLSTTSAECALDGR